MSKESDALYAERIKELENGLEFAIKIGLYFANNPKMDGNTRNQGIAHLEDLKDKILAPF